MTPKERYEKETGKKAAELWDSRNYVEWLESQLERVECEKEKIVQLIDNWRKESDFFTKKKQVNGDWYIARGYKDCACDLRDLILEPDPYELLPSPPEEG